MIKALLKSRRGLTVIKIKFGFEKNEKNLKNEKNFFYFLYSDFSRVLKNSINSVIFWRGRFASSRRSCLRLGQLPWFFVLFPI